MEETMTITLSRYLELIRKEERIEAVARMFDRCDYFATNADIAAVLGIDNKVN